MLTINTNLSSLIAQRSMKSSTTALNQAIERMSTGYKINHSRDNAAAYSIITQMDTKIGAYNVAEDNAAMGLDMITTANESLSLIQDKLTRLRDLQEQASNGTYGEQSLKAINSEANALVDEINRLYEMAEYNGIKLFGTDGATPAQASEPIATFGLARSVVIDESKRISKVSSFQDGETYYLTNSDDLVALQDLANAGECHDKNCIFKLANNIDMEGITFKGIGTSTFNTFRGVFDGDGYTISNITIASDMMWSGLFNYADDATIVGLNLDNIDIEGDYVGGFIGFSCGNNTVTNCSITGNLKGTNVGGIIGYGAYGPSIGDKISYCTVDCLIEAEPVGISGGIIASLVNSDMGAITSISNSKVLSKNDLNGIFCGDGMYMTLLLENSTYNSYYDDIGIPLYSGIVSEDSVMQNNNPIVVTPGGGASPDPDQGGIDPSDPDAGGGTGGAGGGSDPVDPDVGGGVGTTGTPPSYAPGSIMLQVGVGESWSSQVGVDLSFTLNGIDDLRGIGIDKVTDYFTILDDMLSTVAAKQVTYGAVQNRLESALDEIETQRTNLVSSRSTLRDADIAEVSSQYIKQQILQQASATLMATANQSPSIALQLI